MSFTTRIVVRFAEIDWARVVYFARYFDFAHRAFEDFWNAQPGLDYGTLLNERHVGFPIVHSEGQFFGPLRMGDTARVVMDVTRLTKKSVTSRFTIFRNESDEKLAVITLKQAAIDALSFKPMEYPDDLHAALTPHLISES
jgi:YbgC/YbaW family acyl-CoA thioester hydrolase